MSEEARAAAIALDELGRVVDAMRAYEALVRAGQADEAAFVNLAFLYALTTDFGFATAHGLPLSFARECVERLDGLVATGLAHYPDSADLVIIRQYLPWAFWGAGEADAIVSDLERIGAAGRSDLIVLLPVGTEERLLRSQRLLEALEGDKTQKAKFIRSVLASVTGTG